MAKHKPKWGWKGRYLLSNDGIEIYSDEEIELLAREFDIVDEQSIKEMRVRLEGAANIYRIHRNNHDIAPRPGEMRAAVQEIDDLVSKLRDRLEQMDGLTWQYFWHFEKQLFNYNLQSLETDDYETVESKHGHIIHMAPGKDEGSYYVNYIGRDEHFQSLSILKSYCETTLENIPEDKGARRKSEGLRLWSINVMNTWTECLGREFTITRHKGEPISDAARFSCLAFKTVDPTIPNSRVMTALEYVNRDRNRKRAPRNPT